MEKDRKFSARYYIIRGQQALWKGGPAERDSQYRNIVITSNQFTSTQGKFQVYALEGTGKGIQDGKFADPENEPPSRAGAGRMVSRTVSRNCRMRTNGAPLRDRVRL